MEIKEKSIQTAIAEHLAVNGRLIEEGEVCYTVFNDGMMILQMEGGNLFAEAIDTVPLKLNMNLFEGAKEM